MKKSKRYILCVLAWLPDILFLLCYAAFRIISSVTADQVYNDPTSIISDVYIFLAVLSAAAAILYIISLITYFIYNLKNSYITSDKKIGWGYMLVCIGFVAVPAYWYNFIRSKRY